MKILGIDPGTQTGLAWFEDGRLVGTSTIAPLDLAQAIAKADMVIFENSILQSHVWARKGATHEEQKKIARNVGQVDQICVQIMQLCGRAGKPYHSVSPRAKGEKLNAENFEALTKWTRRTNQHERDAAMVVWPYRNLKVAV